MKETSKSIGKYDIAYNRRTLLTTAGIVVLSFTIGVISEKFSNHLRRAVENGKQKKSDEKNAQTLKEAADIAPSLTDEQAEEALYNLQNGGKQQPPKRLTNPLHKEKKGPGHST